MAPQALFGSLPRWRSFSRGFWLVPDERPTTARHAFCGTHEVRGGKCYLGNHPLLRLASLDTSDGELGLETLGVPFVHLMYCWRCDVGDFEYRLERDGGVTVLGEAEWIENVKRLGRDPEEIRARLREPETDYPYAGYPTAFPLRGATLLPLSSEEQDAIVASETSRRTELAAALRVPRHQVGGLPYLAQGADFIPSCADCNEAMVFLASIGDRCADPRGFTSNDHVQVVYFICPACLRVRAGNMCD